MNDPRNNADGKHVVIQDGRRVSAPMTEKDAQAEAERRNKIQETGTGPGHAGKAEVKVNLFG